MQWSLGNDGVKELSRMLWSLGNDGVKKLIRMHND